MGGMQGRLYELTVKRDREMSIRAEPQPLPENIRSAQPGGGVCYRIELAWGCWRRWWLTHFRPGYVKTNGGTPSGRLPRCAARGHRSARPEVLSQYVRLLLGEDRRPVPLAASDSPGAVGSRRIGPYGRPPLSPHDLGCRLALAVGLVSSCAAGGGAGADRLFFPQSIPPNAAGAGPVGLAGRWHDC